MDSSPSTLWSSSQAHLDLNQLPPIFLSRTHLDDHDLHDLEDQILESGGILTYDITEARIVLSKAERKRRIELDLRSAGLFTEQVIEVKACEPPEKEPVAAERSAKRRKLSHSGATGQDEGQAIVIDEDASTASEDEEEAREKPEPGKCSPPEPEELTTEKLSEEESIRAFFTGENIKVIQVQWFEDCFKVGKLLPVEKHFTYEGRVIERPADDGTPPAASNSILGSSFKHSTPKSILERAKADAPAKPEFSYGYKAQSHRRFGRRFGSGGSSSTAYSHGGTSSTDKTKFAHLLQETTSEYEGNVSSDMPEMPDWVKENIKYACERSTPPDPPNKDFIEELKKIKLARLLTNDEIGVRAYSTSIASLAAYPYKISNPREILQLPGCDIKIANLYIEYINTGKMKPAEDAEDNEELKVLRLFYNIWGVGATTAREFYYYRGWRELDDIVEYGWKDLSRVQQIGVKYYSEFLSPIPRAEVEDIAATITRHAIKVRDAGIQTLVVGGYRRGKAECGDVDIIVSHPSEKQTHEIVTDIVASLEAEGWITHTLLLTLTNSNRAQQTLPFKTEGTRGSGFDTLDKALVVWQDPHWPTKTADLAANPKAKNPNIHRRVDIIISPWRTVGCAVAGWTSGTTFQRDLRRYAKNVKGWKFDSSGVRERGSGRVVDVEGWEDKDTRATDMEEAEKRVFKAFGLVYREPWERCTG
ncbi:DNA polymerase beta-like protein [Delphinella strobiligena]|nr:DNA polymerase beta-like protein [Delphinella strobiligena]